MECAEAGKERDCVTEEEKAGEWSGEVSGNPGQ